MEQNCLERTLAHLLVAGENHPDNPEENNIIAGDQNIGRIEILQIFGLVRPAQCLERPECRGKPGIQCVRILMKLRAAALRADVRCLSRDDCLAAVITVPGGNSVSPPELSGDAPVLDIIRPVEVGLLHGVGNQRDLAVLDRLDRGLYQLVHLHEPLFLYHRLHRGTAAVMRSDIVRQVFDTDEQSHLIEFADDGFSCRIPVHALIFAAVLIDGRVIIQNIDDRQVVPFADLKVVRVMRRRNLYNAGSLFHVRVLVADNRNRAVHNRQHCLSADQVLVTRVFGVDRKCGIAEHGFRTGCCELEKLRPADGPVLFNQWIFDMPEMACLFLVFHFRVGNRSMADRAPVDDTVPLVNPSFFMHPHKRFGDGAVASLIHCETLAVPVAGRSELFELRHDSVAVLFPPFPALLKEAFSSKVRLGNALLLQRINDLDFCRDGRVVRSRLPERVIALHSLEADDNILHGLVQRVSHVQLTGDIRRRNDNGERLFAVIHLGVEILLLFPLLIQTVLNLSGIVCLGQFLFHNVSSMRVFMPVLSLPAAAAPWRRAPMRC